MVSFSSGVVISSALSAGLISSGSGPSSVESCDIVGLAFGCWFFFPDLVNQGRSFALELSLGCGGHLVHPLDGDGFLLLLCHHRSELRRESRFEQVHFEEVDPHGIILPQKSPEGCIGDPSVDVVVWVRDFGVVLVEALPDDSGGLVIRVSSSLVVSLDFMARFDNPSRISSSGLHILA